MGWLWLGVSGGCLFLMVLSLGLCVQYLYIPERDNLVERSCNVSCIVQFSRCTTNDCQTYNGHQTCKTRHYNCWAYNRKYVLNEECEGLDVIKRSYPDYDCPSPQDCYYDQREGCRSLSLSSSRNMAGGISTVVIFCVFSFGFLVWFCWLAFKELWIDRASGGAGGGGGGSSGQGAGPNETEMT